MSVGEIVFPLGISLSAFFIWPISIAAYQGSCLVLGLSDGIAGYIGEKYGKTKYNLLGGDKTIEGSSVFFLVTLFIFVLYYLFYTNIIFAFEILLIFMYVAFITFLESIFCRGWDNIIIPFVSGIILIFILS